MSQYVIKETTGKNMNENELNREEIVFQKENDMWEAARNRDVTAFKELVAEDAIMICGGYRCLGAEYAEYIKDFYIDGYEIKNKEVIFSNEEAVQIHYVIEVKTEVAEALDLGGVFHIVSLWKMKHHSWKLYFNMDSRIVTGNN